MTNQDDHELRNLLRSWDSSVRIPNDFNSQVWTRISAQERVYPGSWWNQIQLWAQERLVEPRFVVALASVVLLLSVMVGKMQSQTNSDRELAQMGKSYIASVDPYVKAQAMVSR